MILSFLHVFDLGIAHLELVELFVYLLHFLQTRLLAGALKHTWSVSKMLKLIVIAVLVNRLQLGLWFRFLHRLGWFFWTSTVIRNHGPLTEVSDCLYTLVHLGSNALLR